MSVSKSSNFLLPSVMISSMVWVQARNMSPGSEIRSLLMSSYHPNRTLASCKPPSEVNFDGEMRPFMLMEYCGLRGLLMMSMARAATVDTLSGALLVSTQHCVVSSMYILTFASLSGIYAISGTDWENSISSDRDVAVGISFWMGEWISFGPQSLHSRMVFSILVMISDMTHHLLGHAVPPKLIINAISAMGLDTIWLIDWIADLQLKCAFLYADL